MKPFLKLPDLLISLRNSLNKDKPTSIQYNIYYQDESRFGLMTHTGRCLTAKAVKPIVNYQHKFSNTYLWGSYSPIDGDSFVWEVEGVNSVIFQQYLNGLSAHRPDEHKILFIDNAGFHSTAKLKIPHNIHLINIPPYCPELNPCEQIWQHIKKSFRNQTFKTMENLKEWLYHTVSLMDQKLIKSIVANHRYLDIFNRSIYN